MCNQQYYPIHRNCTNKFINKIMFLEDHYKPLDQKYEQSGDKRQNIEATQQQFEGFSSNKMIKYASNTIPLGVKLCNSSSIHNIEYSSKYGLLLVASDNKVVVKTTDELDTDLANQKQSPKGSITISFSGELFLSPDEEILAICSESLMQFIKVSSLGKHNNIQAPPIPNLSEANHYLWVDNTHFLCWKFQDTATLYNIDPKTLNLIGDEQQLQIEEVTGASVIHEHLFLISKKIIRIYSPFKGKAHLKATIDMNYPNHQFPYFNQCYIIDIFKVNIIDEKFTVSSVFGLIVVYYDVEGNASDERFLTFAKGDIFNQQSLVISGYQKFISTRISKELFYNDGQKLGFGVKRIVTNGAIYILLQKSQKLYALNSFDDFDHLTVKDIKITDEAKQEIQGISLISNIQKNKNTIPLKDIQTQAMKKYREQFVSLQSKDEKASSDASILVVGAGKLSKIYEISLAEGRQDRGNEKTIISKPISENTSQKEDATEDIKVEKKQKKMDFKSNQEPKIQNNSKQAKGLLQNFKKTTNNSSNIFSLPQSSSSTPKTLDSLFKTDANDTSKPQLPLFNTLGGGRNIFAQPSGSKIFNKSENSISIAHSIQTSDDRRNLFSNQPTNINRTSENDVNLQTNKAAPITDSSTVGYTKKSLFDNISAPEDNLSNWIKQISKKDDKVKILQSADKEQQNKSSFPVKENISAEQKPKDLFNVENKKEYLESRPKKQENSFVSFFNVPAKSIFFFQANKQAIISNKCKISYNLNEIHKKLQCMIRWQRLNLNRIQFQHFKDSQLNLMKQSDQQYLSFVLLKSKISDFEANIFSNVMQEFVRKTQHLNFRHIYQPEENELQKKWNKYDEISNKTIFYSSLLGKRKALRASTEQNQSNKKSADILNRLIHQNEEKISYFEKVTETIINNFNAQRQQQAKYSQSQKKITFENNLDACPKTINQPPGQEVEYTIVQHKIIDNIPIIKLPNFLNLHEKTSKFVKNEHQANRQTYENSAPFSNLFKQAKQVQSSKSPISALNINIPQCNSNDRGSIIETKSSIFGGNDIIFNQNNIFASDISVDNKMKK